MAPLTIVAAVSSLLLLNPLEAASLNSGATFLRIDPGAKPASMAGAYTAISGDLNSMHFNPAGLSGFKQRELGATHAQYLGQSQYDFLAFAQPSDLGNFGFSVTRLGTQINEARDDNRQSTDSFGNSNTSYSLAFSRPVQGLAAIGANVKYIESQILSYRAHAFAADVGAMRRLRSLPLSIGISVMNIGQPMRFLDQADPLPLTIAVGSVYHLAGAFQVAMDVRREVYDQNTDVRVGCEYALLPTFALRLGHQSQVSELGAAGFGLSMLSGLGAGFGLRLGRYSVDYGFSPYGSELGNVQRISTAVRF